jgi:hypothetical protein
MPNFEAKITFTAVTGNVDAAIKSISQSLSRLKAATAGLNASMSQLSAASANFGGKLRNLTFFAAAAGTAVFGLVKKQADLGEQLSLMSQKSGVSVENLQKLGYVAQLNQISMQDFGNSLKFLNKSIAIAATDANSDQAKAFKSMGIKLNDVHGNIKAVNDVALEMADKFKKAPDGPKKLYTATTLLSKAGERMIPVFNMGSEAIKKQGDEYERLHGLMSGDEAKAADEFGDNIQRLGFAIQGVGAAIANTLMPALGPMIIEFREWIVNNRNLIKDNVINFIKDLAEAFRGLWSVMSALKTILSPIIMLFGGLENVVRVLGAVYIANLALSFGRLVVALVAVGKALSVIGFAALLTPAGAVVGAIVAIGVVLTALGLDWDNVFSSMKKTFEDFGKWLGGAAFDVVQKIQSVRSAIGQTIGGGLYDATHKASPGASSAPASPLSAIGGGNQYSMLPASNPPQRLDVNMKIDVNGKVSSVTATSNGPIDFTANTGMVTA